MNLPFGLPVRKDINVKKREESENSSSLREHKLTQYRDTLESYKEYLLNYSAKLENFEKRSLDNQLSVIQSALDITYLKEQIDNSIEMLEEMKTDQMNKTLANLEHLITTVLDMSYKMEGLDKNVVNRLSDFLLELQKQNAIQDNQRHEELVQEINQLNQKVKRSNTLLAFLFLFNLIILGGLGFVIAFIFKIM